MSFWGLPRKLSIITKVALGVFVLVVLYVGSGFLFFPPPEIAPIVTPSLVQGNPCPGGVATSSSPFVVFSSFAPEEKVSALVSTVIYWEPICDEVQDTFKNFRIILELQDSHNTRISSIGDGYKLNETQGWITDSTTMGYLSQLKDGEKYHIHATLHHPFLTACDYERAPADCVPVYSDEQTALIKAAKSYVTDSEPFTFSGLGPSASLPPMVEYSNPDSGISFRYPIEWVISGTRKAESTHQTLARIGNPARAGVPDSDA